MSFFIKPSIPPSMLGQPNGVATLDNTGKIPVSQLPNAVLTFEGTWDASTNTPTLADGIGNPGSTYIINVEGTQDLGHGPILYHVGDYLIYDGTEWLEAAGQQANFPLLAPSENTPLPYSFKDHTSSGLWIHDFGGGNVQIITAIDGIDVSAVLPQGLRVPDGSVSAPSYTFNNDNSSGLYFAPGELNLSIAGSRVAKFTSSELTVPALALDSGMRIFDTGSGYAWLSYTGNLNDVAGMLAIGTADGGNGITGANHGGGLKEIWAIRSYNAPVPNHNPSYHMLYNMDGATGTWYINAHGAPSTVVNQINGADVLKLDSTGITVSGTVKPDTNSTRNLGDPTHKWNTLYLTAGTFPVLQGTAGQFLQTNGAGTLSWATVTVPASANPNLSNLQSPTAINQSLLPATSNSIDIGSSALRIANEYVHNTIQIGNPASDAKTIISGSRIDLWYHQQLGIRAEGNGVGIYSLASTIANFAGDTGILFHKDTKPGANNAYDLGSSGLNWRTLYVQNVSVGSNVTLPDGSLGAPALRFTNAATSGIYRSDINEISLVANGIKCIRLANTGLAEFPHEAQFRTGTASDVPLFFNNGYVGLFSPAANSLGVSCSLSEVARFDSNGLQVADGLKIRFGTSGPVIYEDQAYPDTVIIAANPNAYANNEGVLAVSTQDGSTYIRGARNTGNEIESFGIFSRDAGGGTNCDMRFYLDGATGNARINATTGNVLRISSQGDTLFDFNNTDGLQSYRRLRMVNGSSATPAYSFTDSPNTGLWLYSSPHQIVATIDGTDVLAVTSDGIINADGSSAAPSYSFVNSTSSGLFWNGAQSEVAVSVAGNIKFVVGPNEVDVRDADLYIAKDGTVTDPSLWIGNTNTALFSPLANCLGIACDELEVARFTPTKTYLGDPTDSGWGQTIQIKNNPGDPNGYLNVLLHSRETEPAMLSIASPASGDWTDCDISANSDGSVRIESFKGAAATGELKLMQAGDYPITFHTDSVERVRISSAGLKVGAYTLPLTDGTSGQVLQTDGAGAVSWQTPSGGASFPLSAPDSTSSTPTYSFTNSAASGLWYSSAGTPILAINFDQSQPGGGSVVDLQDGYADIFAGSTGLMLNGSPSSIQLTDGTNVGTFDWGTWDLYGGLRLDVNGNCRITFSDYASTTRIEATAGKYFELIQNDTGFWIGSTNQDPAVEIDYATGRTTIYGAANTQLDVDGDVATPANDEIRMKVNNVVAAKVAHETSAGKTRFWLYDNDTATLVQVEVGAADSGGTGYKVLRIPN